MKYGIYTIRDKVAECGGYPFYSRNNGTAARVYRDFIQKNTMHTDNEEFELLLLGTWDEEICKIETSPNALKIDVAMPPSVNSKENG